MYYEILKEMNPRMKLAMADGSLYVLKVIRYIPVHTNSVSDP